MTTTTTTAAPAVPAPAVAAGADWQATFANLINRAANAAIDVRVAQELAPMRQPQATVTAPAPTSPAGPMAGLAPLVPLLLIAGAAFFIVRAVRK